MLARIAALPRLALLALACLLVILLRADLRRLGARLLAAPRVVVVALVCLLSTATIAVAAEKERSRPAPVKRQPPATAQTLVVPDVRGQAFVFAKGMLEDEGFAWRVTGPVGGYAANHVASQSPSPGARVLDNGSPTITLQLTANSAYAERGTPQNAAPYAGRPAPPPGR